MGRDEPRLSPNAKLVLERRYLRRDAEQQIVETPAQMFWRVAKNVAGADALYDGKANVESVADEFYQLMADLTFLPNSPTLMNAGTSLQQLSACFVLPVNDSLTDIFDTLKHAALIHQSGGGTGFSFSRLRPRGDLVRSTGGLASGPVSFLTIFDATTSVIKQGGTRRGANMGILSYDHPDILEFINIKRQPGAVSAFNLSVAVTDDFLQAAESGAEIGLVNPRTGQVVARMPATRILDEIVANAWEHGEPGMVFLDRINRDNPTPHLGAMEATNPCGEQPLLPYESCNLGSINLNRLLRRTGGRAEIDWALLSRVIRQGVHFLDNVIDVNRYPLGQIARICRGNRKIGLGIMGFADVLIELGIPYDSDEALAMADRLGSTLKLEALGASEELARKRGVFPYFKGSVYDRPGGPRVRNATRTTIAPTGTISIIANCSSGIEPVFALSYFRRVLDGEELVELHPALARLFEERGFDKAGLGGKIAERGGVQGLSEIPDGVRRWLVTALDIEPHWHVRMQAAFQRHVDNAVSKTVNFRPEATREQVRDVFLLAHELDCKGVTVYRYGTRERQVLNLNPACPSCTWEGVHTDVGATPAQVADRAGE